MVSSMLLRYRSPAHDHAPSLTLGNFRWGSTPEQTPAPHSGILGGGGCSDTELLSQLCKWHLELMIMLTRFGFEITSHLSSSGPVDLQTTVEIKGPSHYVSKLPPFLCPPSFDSSGLSRLCPTPRSVPCAAAGSGTFRKSKLRT